MTKISRMKLAAACLAIGIAVGFATPSMAEEEATVEAFSAWQGRGQIFPTGSHQATFVGAFSGMIYVETEQGPLDAGFMVCPAMFEIDLENGTQTGNGRCTISAKDGGRVFAEWTCSGVHLVGCNGDFKLTGGTDRFEGITGGGPMVVRSGLRDIAAMPGNTIQESAAGIAIWRQLHYRIP